MLKFVYMEKLNFKSYQFKIKNNENKQYVFDEIRKKNVLLTPEEWVRQNCIQFLIHEKQYPRSLISIEKKISLKLFPSPIIVSVVISLFNNDCISFFQEGHVLSKLDNEKQCFTFTFLNSSIIFTFII